MMRGRKVAAWKRLSLPERDVLTVLSAICKVPELLKLSWQSGPVHAARQMAHRVSSCP